MSVTAVPLQPVKKSVRIWLWLGIVVAIAAAFGLAWMGTREQVVAKMTNEEFLAWNKTQPGVTETASGLQYKVLTPGEGPNPTDGANTMIAIEGRFRDGKIFQPRVEAPFPIQPNTAMPGFLESLKLMNKGASYRVWLPSDLAYDRMPQGAPPEFAGKIVIFDITLKDFMSAEQVQQQMLMQQQLMGPQPGPDGAPHEGEAPGR